MGTSEDRTSPLATPRQRRAIRQPSVTFVSARKNKQEIIVIEDSSDEEPQRPRPAGRPSQPTRVTDMDSSKRRRSNNDEPDEGPSPHGHPTNIATLSEQLSNRGPASMPVAESSPLNKRPRRARVDNSVEQASTPDLPGPSDPGAVSRSVQNPIADTPTLDPWSSIGGTNMPGASSGKALAGPIRYGDDEDDEEEEEKEPQQPLGDDQRAVLEELASGNYQGRNALSSLYDEESILDVATLPMYPDLDSLKERGLKADLHPHQSQGLAWMIRHEHPLPPRRRKDKAVMLWSAKKLKAGRIKYKYATRSRWQVSLPEIPRGGILSDDMGLGKTVQIIALCLDDPTGKKIVEADKADREAEDKQKSKTSRGKNKHADLSSGEEEVDEMLRGVSDPLDESFIKTTLVVCPLGVIYNWTKQLEEHTDPAKVKFAVYHGDGVKTLSKQDWSQYDFIITTYDVLKAEYRPVDITKSARANVEARDELIEEKEQILRQVLSGELNSGGRDLVMLRTRFRREIDTLKEERDMALNAWAKYRRQRRRGKLPGSFPLQKRRKQGTQADEEGRESEAETSRAGQPYSDSEWSLDGSTHGCSSDDSDSEGMTAYYTGGAADYGKLFAFELPRLFTTKFRRLVLDEAHVSRNPKTLIYRAIIELNAERRWCVTGTPLINGTLDLHSLCAYLRMLDLDNLKFWREFIETPMRRGDPRASKLLRDIIFCTTLRRTKNMRNAEGLPLVQLPPIQFFKHTVELDYETREFYDAVFDMMKRQLERMQMRDELESSMLYVIQYLCRLRQICCSRDLVPPDYLQRLQEAIERAEAEAMERAEAALVRQGGEEPSQELSQAQIEDLQDKLRAQITTGLDECPICMDTFKDPRITPCMHVFCLLCITETIARHQKCPMDRNPLTRSTPLIALPTREQVRDDLQEGHEEADEPANRRSQDTIGGNSQPETPSESAKIDQLVEMLRATERNALQSGTDAVKSLVFSNFVKFLDKIEVRLKREGIPYCVYNGSMSKKERERVLRSFDRPIPPSQRIRPSSTPRATPGRSRQRTLLEMLNEEYDANEHVPEWRSKGKRKASLLAGISTWEENLDPTVPHVMLISIQSGALGLNLTAASQVFILDPWWQGQTEAQAIDRVHRIGQTRPVKVFQFVCTDTIEDRVIEIQDKKNVLINESFSGIRNRGEAIDLIKEKRETRMEDILRIFGITAHGGDDDGDTGGPSRRNEPLGSEREQEREVIVID